MINSCFCFVLSSISSPTFLAELHVIVVQNIFFKVKIVLITLCNFNSAVQNCSLKFFLIR